MNKSILTKREKDIFELLIQNKTTDEISKILNISPKTIRNHISNVLHKLEVQSRYQAIFKLIKIGELSLK